MNSPRYRGLSVAGSDLKPPANGSPVDVVDSYIAWSQTDRTKRTLSSMLSNMPSQTSLPVPTPAVRLYFLEFHVRQLATWPTASPTVHESRTVTSRTRSSGDTHQCFLFIPARITLAFTLMVLLKRTHPLYQQQSTKGNDAIYHPTTAQY